MSVKVIAGSFKRRVLKTPPGLSTRPTGARVREALFSILGDLGELEVLDLYAGSGALGIEALSRGAAHATFVENERHALSCIRDNIALLGLDARTSVLSVDVERLRTAFKSNQRRFDLVFCDPPWAHVERALSNLEELPAWLREGARVVLEHPARRTPELRGFLRVDERTWGDTGMSIFIPESVSSTDRSADAS
ncbi:MAG TPA: 16S rRNA (guanine(966)-N(2))-methyltransferase RsmD [Polyangiaceae bacterium]|nr:16S rRNA (guanine(966)-N(2))-methyltransferase RsmD [Polyangiaceae bacterium]